MKEIEIFGNIPVIKAGQKTLVERMKDALVEGEVDPIESIVKAKSLYEVLSVFLKDEDVKECVEKECDKYGKGESPNYCGAVVQIKEAGVKWDYKNCEDPLYDSLSLQMEELKQQMKQRETYLKTITSSKTEIDEETGEIYTIFPPVRTASTSYSVTFKK